MRKIFAAITLVSTVVILHGCDFLNFNTIHGNGKLTTETRNTSTVSKIESHGFFDVEIVNGTSPLVKVEADENLIPFILTENHGGTLVIRSKDHTGLSSDNRIKVYVTTDEVEGIALSGSGNVTSDAKVMSKDRMKLSISGSGDINLDIDAPYVESSISGSGNIHLSGDTKDSKVTITGNGDYKGQDLRAENANVHITGSGNISVSPSVKLEVHITGSGDVYYKGTPQIEQHITGSGNIKQM